MKRRILVVDDESGIRESLSMGLSREGYEVAEAEDGSKAIDLAATFRPDLALVDVRLPVHDGLWVLKHLRAEGVTVVMISGNATLREAVRAVKEGAFDFLEKPLSIDKVLVTISRALDYEQIKDRVAVLSERSKAGDPLGNSAVWRQILETANRVAPTDAAVLLDGESGTGKEVVAEWIHSKSARSDAAFVAVNMAALPENLVESELFGHEKGAFTGATSPQKGKFELAAGGTIFLDEIGETPRTIQPKLLRALESGEIQRLGSERVRRVDTRIIAATNRDLKSLVSAGQFREDLYFRLNVIPIHLPPLRDRGDDIDLLANFFIAEFGKRYRRPGLTLPAASTEMFRRARWPGNVRELKNLCERLVILSSGEISEQEIDGMLALPAGSAPPAPQVPASPTPAGSASPTPQVPASPTPAGSHDDASHGGELHRRLDAAESEILREVISACAGNLSTAAHRLGISRSQLYRKLERLGMKEG